jgi:hypothetical protein
MIPDLNIILDSFVPVRLEEMDRVKLMDRIDTKYVFPASRVTGLLLLMKGKYKVLEIDSHLISDYTTIYFDTPEHFFFNQHVTGRSGRIKVRFRNYNSGGVTFLEIKKKTKKNRTVKWRIENIPSNEGFDERASEFLNMHFFQKTEDLKPVIKNSFKRVTFAGIDIPERVTLDFDISFTDLNDKKVDINSIAIAELKSEGLAVRSPFAGLIRQLGIHPTGFSKYCIGSAILNDLPRTNILKPKLLLIKRIENEYHGTSGT